MRLEFDVIKFVGKIRGIGLVLSLLSASFMASSAYSQDRIRANPDYKGPTNPDSFSIDNDILSEDFRRDFNQFLDQHEEPEQYILLKEPEDRQNTFVSTDAVAPNRAPVFNLDHQYKFDRSLSFSIAPGLIGGIGDENVSGGSQMVLSMQPAGSTSSPFNQGRSLKLMLGSSFVKKPAGRFNSILQNSLLTQRAFNLSLGVGYSGFNVGASFSQSDSLFSSELTGYDVGFGYAGESWSANVRVGEYSRANPLLAGREFGLYSDVSAYELGAAYRLFPNVSLTGRLTYYSYGLGADVVPVVDVKSLILGTNVSF